MRCGFCGHEWDVTPDWLVRFDEATAGCPACGTDCRSEDRPNFCADPGDQAHYDHAVRAAYWYHSSTHVTWPDHDFDPATCLTEEIRRRMEAATGPGAVQRWTERQKAKALHVGSYEAAIENMFRRMHDEASSLDQFYLYRVQLDPSCSIHPGIEQEPTNWLGDAYLADVCSPETTVFRYVNVHEDPSGVSLAIEPAAVLAVQRISIPLAGDPADPWVASATQRLIAAAAKPVPASPAGRRGKPWRQASPLSAEAHALELEIAEALPPRLRRRFRVDIDEDAVRQRPADLAIKLAGLARLVTRPEVTLKTLDAESWQDAASARRDPDALSS